MNRFWKNFKTVDFKPKNVPFILGKTRIFKKRPLTLSNPNYMQRIKKKQWANLRMRCYRPPDGRVGWADLWDLPVGPGVQEKKINQ